MHDCWHLALLALLMSNPIATKLWHYFFAMLKRAPDCSGPQLIGTWPIAIGQDSSNIESYCEIGTFGVPKSQVAATAGPAIFACGHIAKVSTLNRERAGQHGEGYMSPCLSDHPANLLLPQKQRAQQNLSAVLSLTP